MPFEDVDNRAAVGDDKALESPGVAQVLLQKHGVCAGWPAIDGVIGAHDRLHMAFGHGGAEGRQESFFKIARRRVYVESVAEGLGAAVDGKMLAFTTRIFTKL